MIIQTAKPVFYAHCDMCGAENRLEIDYNLALLPDTQAADQADSHGFSCVNIRVETAGKRLRGLCHILVCPICLRTLVSVLRTPSDQLWEELSRFMPEDIKGQLDEPISQIKQLAKESVFESVKVYAGLKGPSRPPEVTTHIPKGTTCLDKICSCDNCIASRNQIKRIEEVAATAAILTPKGTIGLPASTAAILQSTASEQGAFGPEEQAALRRLVSQEGTLEDIGLFREIATLAKINLPVEAQLRDFDSVHEELRRNA